jgi:hypothetical protein
VLACRAPTRDPLISTCCTIRARPSSIMPKTNRKNSGAIIANSAAATPDLWRSRPRPLRADSDVRRGVRFDKRMAFVSNIIAPLFTAAKQRAKRFENK